MVNTKEMTESLIKELAFSEEELRELKAAKEKPIVFDEDCPETTPERALKFRRVNPPRGAGKKRAAFKAVGGADPGTQAPGGRGSSREQVPVLQGRGFTLALIIRLLLWSGKVWDYHPQAFRPAGRKTGNPSFP